MKPARRVQARVANGGLILFGLAIVTILGTGGTQIRLGPLDVGLHSLANPVLGFALFGVLRVLVSRHDSGLEGWIIRFYARQGLPPRHAECRVCSALGSGAWLGAGVGAVVGAVDGVHFLLTASHPGPGLATILRVLAVEGVTAVAGGALIGLLLGPLTYAVLRWLGRRPSRFDLGRGVLCMLLLTAPLLLRVETDIPSTSRSPWTLLGTTAAFAVSAVVVFGLLPAAILRARRGRWGVTLTVGGGVALLGFLVGIGTIGPPSVPGAGPESGHPNVLLISVSGLRADALEVYGSAIAATPNIDMLATRGRAFQRPVTPSTGIRPAASSLLTGLYPQRHGVRSEGDRLPRHVETIGDLLGAHGYGRAAFVSSRELDGWETGLARSFDHYGDVKVFGDYLDRLAIAGLWSRAGGEHRPRWRSSGETAREFGAWAARQPGPWLAWVSFVEPARPVPMPPLDESTPVATGDVLWPAPGWVGDDPEPRPISEWLRGYASAVQSVDAAVGTMLRGLAARGEMQRTMILVTGLQGTSLGENGVWLEAGESLSEGTIHVPWITGGPLVVIGEPIPGPVSLVDVVPTLMGLLGLSGDESWQGEDLSRYLIDPNSPPRDANAGPVFSEVVLDGKDEPPAQAVSRGDSKLVRRADGTERFLIVDRVEREVFAPRGRYARQRQSLSDMLTRFMETTRR